MAGPSEVDPRDALKGLTRALAHALGLTEYLARTSPQPRGDVGGSFASRRGHGSQLSISDPSHHVTEAIGTLYGDEDDSGSENGRPLSFIPGAAYQDHIQRVLPAQNSEQQSIRRSERDHEPVVSRLPLGRSISDQPQSSAPQDDMRANLKKAQTMPIRRTSQRDGTQDHGQQPVRSPMSLRDVQAETPVSQFPLTNIDNPTDIAQELSNLQALRRMSMDVGSYVDPDMPPMSLSAMPVIAPSGDDDENDPSRLLWVPARVHPELAPTEFKSFLEKRVQSIRRRSGDSFMSSGGDLSRSNSGSGSLRRQKSMLSRQIDNSGGRGAVGYVDGAERLERKRSQEGHDTHRRELSIDDLVNDPSKVVQKLTQDSQDQLSSPEGNPDDKPILPMAPGMGLRRSTRTTYRKGGSLRSGDKAPFSRRIAQRQQDNDTSPPVPNLVDAPPGHTLTRVQSEPIAENYSRPKRSVRRQGNFLQDSAAALAALEGPEQESASSRALSPPYTSQEQSPVSSLEASSSNTRAPKSEDVSDQQDSQYMQFQYQQQHQQRSEDEPVIAEPPPRSNLRPSGTPLNVPHAQPQQYTSKQQQSSASHTLSDALAANTSSLSSGGTLRTDNLTIIPTFNQEERKPEGKKSKKDRDDDSSSVSSIKSSSTWKWFKSSGDDKKEKKEDSKKSKTNKAVNDKAQDNVRLDVIQTSIDKSPTPSKGRESLVLDRDNVDSKLLEERKKESNRKSDTKRDKDGSIFSSIFGGSKRKEEKEKTNKKAQHLQIPEDPPYKPLVPDVDYNWTRFPLLEERAIYRMAHIKLANPRRSLQSQVLLSNFMYSYLAIVQAMHPQMNVPTSPQQKRLEEEARRKQQELEYQQQQQQQLQEQDSQNDLDQYDYDYHRAAVQYADTGSDDQVDYVDEAQIYEDEHGNENHNDYGYEGSEGYGQGSKEYYQYHGNGDGRRHDGRDDMW
ncbi:telomere silencing protein Zds1 [Paramyrothecium foliicola]|nr:telomere silencing protein Zds1 [Paramyrothecium foliicola]